MLNIKLRLRALTPIHIGSGEFYEPINFVIDDKFLYEFDEFKFYKNLDERSKMSFSELASRESDDVTFKLASFVKEHKAHAKKATIKIINVFNDIRLDYDEKVGKVVAIEDKDGKKEDIFNKFSIAKTARSTNDNRVYIPGSSLKGAISTALQEMVYKKDKRQYEDEFFSENPAEYIMKNLSISDAIASKPLDIIGYSHNVSRFHDTDKKKAKLRNMIEVVYKDSLFEADITFKDLEPKINYGIKDLIKSCNDHYLENFQSIFRKNEHSKAQYIYKYLKKEFYGDYLNFEPKEGQFLLRVGKHSGARAVTIDGIREIMVKVGEGEFKKLDHETTTWMFGSGKKGAEKTLLPFGWLLCEIIK